jgi:hypothetical protein
MDFSIASILMLDGVTNGAIYALLGLATVLVFTVTRIIFIPQGEFVAYGALTLAMLQTGKVPGTVWLLFILAVVAALMEGVARWRHNGQLGSAMRAAFKTLVFPVLVAGLAIWAAPQQLPMGIQVCRTGLPHCQQRPSERRSHSPGRCPAHGAPLKAPDEQNRCFRSAGDVRGLRSRGHRLLS